MRTTFPLARLIALRRKYSNDILAWGKQLDSYPDGWSISPADPGKILDCFNSLSLQPGYVLRAYQYKSGSNGNGIVWAMPMDEKLPEPSACEHLTERFLEPPKPRSALDNFMDAIAGDGSAWSYLSASLLRRELQELGAMWHGCSWSSHEILGGSPWRTKMERPDFSPAEAWKWVGPKPLVWRPHVQFAGDAVTVRFLTFTALGEETIIEHTDTFKKGHYRFAAATEILATGRGGYVY